VVVAAAGYGKTTAVNRWLREIGPEQDRILVVDIVHRDGVPGQVDRAAKLVLISRTPVSAATLLHYDLGAPVEIGPRQLALSEQQTARLLALRYGIDGTDVTATVHRLTAGWPALVHLAGARLAAEGLDGALDEQLTAPGTPLADYLCAEVLAELPRDAVDLLAGTAELGSISTELAGAIGQEHAAPHIALLARTGLLLPPVPGRRWYQPVPMVAAAARTMTALSTTRRKVIVALAAEWHMEHGRLADALRLAVAGGDGARCAALLIDHGPTLLADGAATERRPT
jgi:ATP/maltotriose-dependent transcriptional regulator MalT